jgi:hypothetical protein
MTDACPVIVPAWEELANTSARATESVPSLDSDRGRMQPINLAFKVLLNHNNKN